MKRVQPNGFHQPRFFVAVAAFIAIVASGMLQVVAQATERHHGAFFVEKTLAVVAGIAFVVGLWDVRRKIRVRLAIAGPVFTAVSAIALAVTLRTLGMQEGSSLNAAIALGGIVVAIGSAVVALAAVHELGHAGVGTVHFLIVEAIAIVLAVWTHDVAPELLALLAIRLMYRSPPPPPHKLHRAADAERVEEDVA